MILIKRRNGPSARAEQSSRPNFEAQPIVTLAYQAEQTGFRGNQHIVRAARQKAMRLRHNIILDFIDELPTRVTPPYPARRHRPDDPTRLRRKRHCLAWTRLLDFPPALAPARNALLRTDHCSW